MRLTWQAATHSITALRTTLFTTALCAALLLPMLYSPGIVHADSVVQYGTAWLNGGGVDIMSGGDGSHSCVSVSGAPGQSQCSNTAGQVYAGDKWQCVEMVNRLYLTKGWTTTTWWGSGSSIINDVPNHPGLTDELQDHISHVNPGDVVTETHSTDGHAGVINSIDSDGTIHIKSQNADLDSQASIQAGTSLTDGTAHYVLSGWIGYSIQAIVHHPVSSTPLRIGAVTTSGGYIAKESDLGSSWTTEATSGVTQGIQSGSLTGIVENGTFYVKQGGLGSGWTTEWNGASAGALSDASGSNPMRIGVLTTSGSFWVREGGLSSGSWVDESDNVVAGYLSGSRIAVLTNTGNLLVKDGSLGSSWTTVAGGVSQAAIAGSLIGVLEGPNYYVKQGVLGNPWSLEGTTIASITLTDAVGSTPIRVGEVTTGGDFWVKESNISTGTWTQVASGVSQGVLSGNLTGALESGTFYVKQGSLTASWVSESINVASGALWSPN